MSERYRHSLSILVFGLLIGLTSGAFGQLSRMLLLLSAFPLLSLYLLLTSRHRESVIASIGIFSAAILILPVHLIPFTGTVALLCSLCAVALVRFYFQKPKDDKYIDNALLTPLIVVFAVLLLQFAILANPLLRADIDRYFRKFSLFLTGTGGIAIPLGTFYFAPTLLFSAALLAIMLPSIKQKISAIILVIASLQGWFILFPLLLERSMTDKYRAANLWYSRNATFQIAGEKLNLDHLLSLSFIEHGTILLGFFLAIALGVAMMMSQGDRPIRFRSIIFQAKKPILISIIFITVLAGLLAGWATSPDIYSRDYIYGKKCAVLTSNIGMNIPRHGSYGHRSVGMFGRLPDELRALGLDVDELTTMTMLRDDHEILLLINLQETFSRPNKEKITEWIRKGGRLLVLTDHTGDEGLRLPVNDLLEDTGLVVNFDTAKAIRSSDVSEFEFLINSPAFSIGDSLLHGADGYGTGASVSTKGKAMPLLQKRYCYIDPGSFTAADRGLLGNLSYDSGEPLGDVTVAGIASYGKGKVILFGDTSPFQNGAWSQTRAFNVQILGLLSDMKNPSLKPNLAIWTGVIVFVLMLITLFMSLRHAVFLCIIPFSISLLGGLLLFMQKPEPCRLYGNLPIAMIDTGHIPYIGKMGWTITDIAGLETGLLREGYIVTINDAPLDKILKKDIEPWVLFLPAPLERFSIKEIASIKSFAGRGGNIIINIGFEESRNAVSLLNAFDLAVTDIPLGSTSDPVLYPNENHINFYNAWQVHGSGEILARVLQCPTAIRKKIGKGSITLIGDSKFFWNANLEGMEILKPGNIRFLTQLVKNDGLTNSVSQSGGNRP